MDTSRSPIIIETPTKLSLSTSNFGDPKVIETNYFMDAQWKTYIDAQKKPENIKASTRCSKNRKQRLPLEMVKIIIF